LEEVHVAYLLKFDIIDKSDSRCSDQIADATESSDSEGRSNPDLWDRVYRNSLRQSR
jgi:hypothetical protein